MIGPKVYVSPMGRLDYSYFFEIHGTSYCETVIINPIPSDLIMMKLQQSSGASGV